MNGNHFNGTINFSEAKIKIFQDGLGINMDLLASVRISFNKFPVITFKLKSEIIVEQNIKSIFRLHKTISFKERIKNRDNRMQSNWN